MNKFLLTLLGGIVIGILVAPDKGSKTRQKLLDGFDDYKDKASDTANDLMDKADGALAKGRTKVNNII